MLTMRIMPKMSDSPPARSRALLRQRTAAGRKALAQMSLDALRRHPPTES